MTDTVEFELRPEKLKFVTLFTYGKRKIFISEPVNQILCQSMKFHIEQGHVKVAGYVIMPDHVHFIMQPLDWDVSMFVSNFKVYTGAKIKEMMKFSKKVWRRRFYDLNIGDIEAFSQRLDLIHMNPVKKKLAGRPGDYPWSSYSCYHGGEGPVQVFVVSDYSE